METPIVSEKAQRPQRVEPSKQAEAESEGVVERRSMSDRAAERYLAIAIPHDGMVPSNNGHKRETLEELIDVLLQSDPIPATLCFYTAGVRWLTRDSPVLSELQEIRRRGAEIVGCRGCLSEAGLLDAVAVGRLDTQDQIDDILRNAHHTMVL
jgi:hypothetical protein